MRIAATTTLSLVLAAQLRLEARADVAQTYLRDAKPVLERFCWDCHGDGSTRGGVSFDGLEREARPGGDKLWWRVLKNTRAGLMPPLGQERLPPEAAAKLDLWIKREALGIDPAHPDPGRVTVRRMNRVEYRNTVRELLGVDYDTQKEFPADDTGYGFDNIADVLTLSPTLLEKYLDAAQAIVAQVVPTRSRVVATRRFDGRGLAVIAADTAPAVEKEALDLSYYTPATVGTTFEARVPGRYRVGVELRTVERFDDASDGNRCRLTLAADGEPLAVWELAREGDRRIEVAFERTWKAGRHELTLAVAPMAPARPQTRNLRVRVRMLTVEGPFDERHLVLPDGYRRFFPRDVPRAAVARRRYAREILGAFATRAFRRPVDADTSSRLVKVAEGVWSQPGSTFEAGVGQAMAAVLASPRFVFREDVTLPIARGEAHPRIDEWSLASRLSYFLWSSMPDDRLFRLARVGQLRRRLDAELDRMLADARSDELVRNFTGQWLQARDIMGVPINAADVFLRDHPDAAIEEARATFLRLRGIPKDERSQAENAALDKARAVYIGFMRRPKPQLNDALRRSMREETERSFAYVLREGRSLLELIDSDYTFLNEELAKHYGIEGVTGPEMRKVSLPSGSPRGGVLTQGTVLAVTSNPTRTSPVKRGVFILDNILGAPTPPPPPNIPALEDVAPAAKLRTMSLRETMALHARERMCASCHLRMDPLGLALESFNAMGMFRTEDGGRPIEASGQLSTGERFDDVRALKRVLVTDRRRDVYQAFSEKLLTYALGRGLEPSDVETVDALVATLESSGGRLVPLLRALVASPPFDRRQAGADGARASGTLATERVQP